MRLLPLAMIMLLLGGMALSSCEEEKKEVIHIDNDPEKTPTMRTTDVSTLISDSGITRYKITAPLWLMFEEAKEPHWNFPKGIHLEKYDLKLKPEAMVECDSAIYFKSKQLWRLDGYVNIYNTAGEKFVTTQLYWDQREQKIYSDSFIHIERDDKIIEGYGFVSNENMTRYNVSRVSAIFPAKNFTEPAGRPDSARIPGPPVPPPPMPGAPADPNRPHMVVSGQADESRIKGRRDLNDPQTRRKLDQSQIKSGAALTKEKLAAPADRPTPANKPAKPGKSPLSR